MHNTQNVTFEDIVSGLKDLGLPSGGKVLAHSALSSFGYVLGGADTVLDALLDVVGPQGTVLVPTLTGDETLSPDNPPFFDPINTVCWTGCIPETLRKRSNAIRSLHPTHSVAAIGADAPTLTRDHGLSITPCDEHSPYYKLAQLADSYILLIGVDHESNTTFHCVEELVGVDYHMQPGFARARLLIEDREICRHYMLHRYGAPRHFGVMEEIFIERGWQKSTQIGKATVRLVKTREIFQLTCRCLSADPQILLKK
jgi:aminoglycoside 3-N-acetyltransferase